MLIIQPAGLNSSDEELASIGVGASVGHGHDTRASVLQLEVLVLELAAVDGLATSAIVVGEVTTLAHEVGDDTVEDAALVAKTLFASAEGTEIFCSPGDDVTPELDNNPSSGLAIDSHVHENTGQSHGFSEVS